MSDEYTKLFKNDFFKDEFDTRIEKHLKPILRRISKLEKRVDSCEAKINSHESINKQHAILNKIEIVNSKHGEKS